MEDCDVHHDRMYTTLLPFFIGIQLKPVKSHPISNVVSALTDVRR